jgi:hypothetical protein
VKFCKLLSTAIILFLSINANATLIDFNTVDSYTSKGRIDRIGDVTFSRDLYNFPDGFQLYNNVAYNYYGESGEFFSFDNAVTLQSLDFAGSFLTLPQASGFQIKLFDSANGLLSTTSLSPSSSQTVSFNQSNVSKVSIEFTGGALSFYGDDRYHAWYTLDNIKYAVTSVPEPTILSILVFGLAGIGLSRKNRKL